MPHLLQSTLKNRLLTALSSADFDLLQPHLQSVLIKAGDVLIQADTPITKVCFVEQGIVSYTAHASDGEQIQVGLIGYEGMVGVPILLDIDRAPTEARVQAAGWVWCLSATALRRAIQDSPSLHSTLLRYVAIVMNEVAGTALANGRYKLDQRLARWLLMCHDRAEGDVVVTTHHLLSLTLGVTRTTLSSTTADFKRLGIIAGARGKITILDRNTLLSIAGAAYGIPENEYARLIETLP